MITIKGKGIAGQIGPDLKVVSETAIADVILIDAIQEAQKRSEQPPFLPVEVALFYYLDAMEEFETKADKDLQETIQEIESDDAEGVIY